MPTIFRDGPYRFYFVSSDRDEPPHIHVRANSGFAKFWLDPVILQRSGRIGRTEIRRIQRIVERKNKAFMEAWHDYFDS